MQDNVTNEVMDCPFEVDEMTLQTPQDKSEATTESSGEAAATMETLTARVRELEQEIEARNSLTDRMTRECEEFEVYFPDE